MIVASFEKINDKYYEEANLYNGGRKFSVPGILAETHQKNPATLGPDPMYELQEKIGCT
jgi:hypothetical protein